MSERSKKKIQWNWVCTGDVQVLWAKLLGLIIRKLSLSSSHSITSWTNILAWIKYILSFVSAKWLLLKDKKTGNYLCVGWQYLELLYAIS